MNKNLFTKQIIPIFAKEFYIFNTRTKLFRRMEKELFQSTLMEKAKAANNNAPIDNLSERTISEVVTMFLPQFAEDEKITDESWNLPVQMVRTISGQLRHDTSTGINDFKSKYEAEQKTAREKAIADAVAAAKAEWEKNKPVETKVEEKKEEKPDIAKMVADQVAEQMKGLTGENSEFGKLSKQFSDYLKVQAAKEKAATEADVRSQVREYLISRGVEEDDFALEYTLEKLVVGDNPDISAMKTKAEKDYEAYYKKIHKGDGAQPFAGGGGGFRDSNTEFQNFIKSKQAEADLEAKEAEELRQHMM